ncbi:MAG: nicotinate-nucleotide adenylyltransferase [Clostridia bacterium]|nr:nicotinate-nucleotide adenylyltransferase [Clostridia bacterium]
MKKNNTENKKYKALGIMGGTFDPIHYGHLVTAEEARCQFNLDVVVFVPSGKPPHKKDYRVSDAKHRYLMTVLAVVTNPFFDVSRIEIDREGYSYTIDTVKAFRKKYPWSEIFFITGADAILEILTWKKVEEIMDHCRFIAATRPGYNLSDLDKKFKAILPEYSNRVETIEVPALAISSTDIRRRVAMDKSIKYLVPEAVEQYIWKNNLYKS